MANTLVEQANDVRSMLEKLKPQFAMALPRHLTPDRLLRVAMTAVQNTPALLDCDRKSLFSAIMACAQLGLEPDGVLGQAYLVPFAGKVQFIPGYKGLITLARNSGMITSIQAHEVRADDEFVFRYGLNEQLDHVPRSDDDAPITHFYAYAKFTDGGHSFEVMTCQQVEKIRDKSQAFQRFKAGKIKSTPWADHFAQMGRKTLIRRLSNYLPREVQKAVAMEAAFEAGTLSELVDGEVVMGITDNSENSDAPVETINKVEGKLDQVAASRGTSRRQRKMEPAQDVSDAEVVEEEAPAARVVAAETTPSKANPAAQSVDHDDTEEWMSDYQVQLVNCRSLEDIDLLVEELSERIASGEIPDIKVALASNIASRRRSLAPEIAATTSQKKNMKPLFEDE